MTARLALLGAVLALVAVVALMTRWISSRLSAPELPTFERITFRDGAPSGARFTPEGRVVFSASFERAPQEVYGYVPGSPGFQPLGIPPARLAAVSSKTGALAVLLGDLSFMNSRLQGTLARVSAVGGVPRELADHVSWADWTGSDELAVVRKGPTGTWTWIERPVGTKVWQGTGVIHELRCSPDGERLAFLHRSSFRSEMIILDRSNAPHVVLTFPPEPGFPETLAWTPDGKRLRFTTAERSGVKLSSVSLHGDVRALYRFPEHRFLEDIAPDGTMIFIAWDAVGRIGLMRPGQPSHRELAWLGSPGIVDLSPDGRTVLFYDGPLVDPQAVLEATDGTPPKVLGAGYPLALSPDGRRVAMTSRDQHGLSLVPTGAGTTEEVPVSGLVVGVGQWSHDGGRLWITARQKDQVRVQLFPVDVVSRKLLEPIAASNVYANAPIAISPDDQWIAAVGADWAITVYPIQKGEPVRISSVRADLFPNLAGWTTTGELWVFLAGATPPRLVRVEVHSGKITQSIDLDRRQIGADEIADVRITPDESLLAVEYGVWRGRLELMKGIPADR